MLAAHSMWPHQEDASHQGWVSSLLGFAFQSTTKVEAPVEACTIKSTIFNWSYLLTYLVTWACLWEIPGKFTHIHLLHCHVFAPGFARMKTLYLNFFQDLPRSADQSGGNSLIGQGEVQSQFWYVHSLFLQTINLILGE